jgi:hypothetical protein
MDQAIARGIAHSSHFGQRTRSGRLLTEHVERVAAAVMPEARSVAFLHDVLERSSTGIAELIHHGLTPLELGALRLLTHDAAECYELYILRIAHASGPEGRLARAVKLADLEDHRGEALGMAGLPPYGWARRHIAFARERLGEASSPARIPQDPAVAAG